MSKEPTVSLSIIRWNEKERETVATAYARFLQDGNLSKDESIMKAMEVLPSNRRRGIVSVRSERPKLQEMGEAILASQNPIAESPVAIVSGSQMAVKPIRVSPISTPHLLSSPTSSVENAIAAYINQALPHMLSRIMTGVEVELEEEIRAQIRTQLGGIKNSAEPGRFKIEFFPRGFDSNDHSELPAASAAVASPPVRTINIAVAGLLDRQVSLLKNKFVKSRVFFRFLSKDDVKRAIKSSGNMDYILVAKDFVSHSFTDALLGRAGIKDKVRLIPGQMTQLTTEIEKIIAEHQN